ncbi:hypothetical protein BFF94_013755 [Burkholderia catarinensis]|nr:hypothetical protein BFF94_013755 [Burkholderia catarinensis]
MTAIMTAFAHGENRSMLNPPFRNGKVRVGMSAASAFVRRASAFPYGKARSRNGQTTAHAPPAESNPFRATGRLSARPAMFSVASPAKSRRYAAACGVTHATHGAAGERFNRANRTAPLDCSKRGRLNSGAAYASDSARYGFVHPPYLAAGFEFLMGSTLRNSDRQRCRASLKLVRFD